jgi:hypothetical protein
MGKSMRRVILFGDSLILEGVRASLAACPDLEIIRLGASVEDLFEIIRALCPAVFIFDLQAVRFDFQLSLLQQPELQLIGIDPESQQAMVWSGRQKAVVVAADLIKTITPKD